MMFRRRHAEQLAALAEAAGRIEQALARVEQLLDLSSPGGLAAVHATVRDARSAVDVLASVAGEMPAAVRQNADAVREIGKAVADLAAIPAPAPVPAAAPPLPVRKKPGPAQQ